jgi:hypothetical protein
MPEQPETDGVQRSRRDPWDHQQSGFDFLVMRDPWAMSSACCHRSFRAIGPALAMANRVSA